MMAAVPPERELVLLFQGLDNYGAGETPQIEFKVAGARENPSAFWAAYEAVVVAANLVTAAANAITTYDRQHAQPG